MTQDDISENNADKPKGRLANPALRLASVFVAMIAICTLLYSLATSLPIIPVMTGIFFLMLWFVPQIWK